MTRPSSVLFYSSSNKLCDIVVRYQHVNCYQTVTFILKQVEILFAQQRTVQPDSEKVIEKVTNAQSTITIDCRKYIK